MQVSSLESDDSIQGENVVTKVFLFTAPKIAALRARIVELRSSNVLSKYPTRTEVLSALIWRSFIKTCRVKAARKLTHSVASTKPIIMRSLANYAVNFRTRLNPPLPHVSFGNIIMDATAESTTRIDHEEVTPGFIETLDELIGQLRLGVNKIDDGYIRKLQEGDVEFLKSLDEASHDSNDHEGDENDENKVLICWLNSLCRFPFYETDFGWGNHHG
ncbi:salutaridinol 7-O-acetyltransferase-like [Papaver somniferum]|uniref:salutaridinol 7-O-acetyltransferase-like n=1 Tax=Papaver somniferum TaxID=3469 RepID=UPI000E701860|nr:salutaridinol 7-O-acetyltransferase-like [Papaver somniferum]